jgi:hypothetical protein
VSDIDARLWRTLTRVCSLLAVGVLGFMLGWGAKPTRSDALFGLLLLALVGVLVAATISRVPREVRAGFRLLPRHRPMLTLTAGLLGVASLLVLCWTITDLLCPGTFEPLSLAFVCVVAAGALILVRRLFRRV